MTTLELIEKHGIGHNCLSDAYELGRQDAIQEFREKINKYLNESTDFADFVVTDGAIDCVIDEMKGGAE